MSIGSVVTVPSLGRLATVVGTAAVGVPQEGRQYMQVRYSARVPDSAAGGGKRCRRSAIVGLRDGAHDPPGQGAGRLLRLRRR